MTSFKAPKFGGGITGLVDTKFVFNPEGIPKELKQRDQWVCWSFIKKEDGETAKAPVYLKQGQLCLSKWSTHTESWENALQDYYSSDLVHGVGFVFTKDDPYIFVDFDKVHLNDSRHKFINAIDTWTEFSQSGNGYHMVVKGALSRAHKPTTGEVEIYPYSRFCAMTGNLTVKEHMKIVEGSSWVEQLRHEYPIRVGEIVAERQAGVASERFELPETVTEGSRNDTMYKYIWSMHGKGIDIEDIIRNAHKDNDERFQPPMEVAEVDDMIERVSEDHLRKSEEAQEEQSDDVDQFIYIMGQNKWYDRVSSELVGRDALITSHILDYPGGDAGPNFHTAWLRHPDHVIADALGWYPVPYGRSIEATFEHEGARLANMWRGFPITPVSGNVAPWVDLLALLIPDEKDRELLLQWFAYAIQYPDKKCNWAPIIMGTEGTGKDLLTSPIHMIFGKASGMVDTRSIKSGFDDEFISKKFIQINEGSLKGDAVENIKRKTASEGNALMTMNPKGKGKVLMPNLFSVMFVTNDIDALKLSPKDRRFFVLEVDRWINTHENGGKEFFDDYVEWRDKRQGPACLFSYLLNKDINSFDPGRAPTKTLAFHRMYEATRYDHEELVEEWEYQKTGAFEHDAILPDTVVKMLSISGIDVHRTAVKKMLMGQMNYRKYPVQIQKKFDDEVRIKSRMYLFKPDFSFDLAHYEMYDIIDDIENNVDQMLSDMANGTTKYS